MSVYFSNICGMLLLILLVSESAEGGEKKLTYRVEFLTLLCGK